MKVNKNGVIMEGFGLLINKTMDLNRFHLIPISNQVSDIIWTEVEKWDKFNRWTIGTQLVRSADSVSANLSEAYGRYSRGERKLFAMYARGSLCETINWIQTAIRRGLIDADTGKAIDKALIDISFKLNGYIRSLRNPS
jgi:four helix bundle protein